MIRSALVLAFLLVVSGLGHAAPTPAPCGIASPLDAAPQAPLLIVPQSAPSLPALIVEPAQPLTGQVAGAMAA